MHVLKGVIAGAGLALEVCDSPEGYEYFPGENHGDTAFAVVTGPAAGTQDAPKVSETASVGKTLTVTTGFAGPWNDAYSRQWMRNGAAIAGATAPTYALTAADRGARISVRVTGQNSKMPWTTSSVAFTSPQTVAVAAGTRAAVTPTMSGSVGCREDGESRGGQLDEGHHARLPVVRGREGDQQGHGLVHTLKATDTGKTLTVKATGKKSGHTTAAKASKATAKVATVKTPTISGTVKVGKKLTAKPGAWTTGTAFTYQWFAAGSAIKGATKSTATVK
ncbi:hypothetical protein LOK55_13495 [Microbacterium sp. F2E]|uniref:hypothetical protein n=1 Tax=Microbacterium sp. F2E TaxID=2895284 RepID=UPI001E34A3D9|nr:hypothetical protein [Microbacterium sp. F2E]MCC9055272.1 hypothetical protein [Microbacterium sp. F2E]